MTSLTKQLQALRTSTSKQLTVEKQHVSLLFDKKEAQTIDRETAYKIGCTGLDQLRKLDPVFHGDIEFFDESAINFQRTMITQEENEALDRRLEKFMFQLMPYMQHFACHQVLEWLIYKYQICSYNAEMIMAIFLPFHETNVYGRLLSIVDFNFSTSKDWGFLELFHKSSMHVPFNVLVKHGLSSGHSLISRVSRLIEQGIQLVGDLFLESKGQLLFTFYAKLMIGMLKDNSKIDDGLLSKLTPLVGSGLKSSILSFRYASLMVICQLSVTVKLASSIVESIVKILLIKMKESSIDSYLSALVVICQQQGVQQFSTKAVVKVLRKEESLGFWTAIRNLSSTTDLLSFLKPLWNTLFHIVRSEEGMDEDKETALQGLLQTSSSDVLSGEQASAYLMKVIEEKANGFVISSGFKKNIYALCTRYSNEFNAIVVEWTTRDEKLVKNFLDYCELNQLLVMFAKDNSQKKRTRKRSGSIRKSSEEDKLEASKTAYEKAEEMANSSEFARRQVFSGDPLKKAMKWLKQGDFENVYWALDEMASRKHYFDNRSQEEVEDFTVDIIKTCISRTDGVLCDKVKSALSQAKISESYYVGLLSRFDEADVPKKKAKVSNSEVSHFQKAFEGETKKKFEKRQQFVLELINISNRLPIGSKIISALFEVVKEVDAAPDGQQQFFSQQLAIGILAKILSDPGTYKVTLADLQMECVVDIMRNTHSHHILRDSLKLLTAAVKLDPCSVTSHVMAVFTFMGSGLLRKDNELTLSIIENTLEALFIAVISSKKNNRDAVVTQLIGVTRIFASSACDIPAHRRGRMAKAISRAIGMENTWIVASVLLEGLCAKWQRAAADASKKAADQDAFEDIALELCVNMGPCEQLTAIFDLMQFVIRLSGDKELKKDLGALDSSIFDRKKYSLPKLRHFRFVIIGLVVKVLSNRNLFEMLAKNDNETLFSTLLPISKRLMITSVDLDAFIQKECSAIEQAGEPQSLRYWVAIQTKAEIISDKLRHLLPGGVAARLISDILQDEKTDAQMRDKALQLANLKLMQDGYFYSEGGINEEHLIQLADVLNNWIAPHRSEADSVLLCQNAAFSLKLIAKRLPIQTESTVLSTSMQKCVETAALWQTLDEYMVGNILLLAGELIRSHNMRSTMLSAEPLLKLCVEILTECITNTNKEQAVEEDNNLNKRQRVRQQSLGGRKHGSDTLLICSLTCMQRILDRYAAFVTGHLGAILINFSRLCARFWDADGDGGISVVSVNNKNNSSNNNKGSVHHRLFLVRSALQQIEPRVLPAQFARAVSDLVKEEKSLSALFSVLSGYFTMKNRLIISQIRVPLVTDVFLKALEYRSIDRKPESFENVCNVERSIFAALLKMLDILTEVEIRPIINSIVQWAEPGLSSNDMSMKVRIISVYCFANQFYNSFNSLALPYFGKLIEMSSKILRRCNASVVMDTTELLLNGKKHTTEGVEVDFLITQILDFVSNCGRHKEFLTQDRAETLVEALVEELVNTKVAGHEKRCVPHLAEALYRVSEAASEVFPVVLNKVLLKTRSNKPKIRYRTLLVIEAMFDKINDGIVPHLPTIMPFLSELLEDENVNVEDQCSKVVQLLQNKFGENIAEGFA